MKTYSGYITTLNPNQVFVFGSNLDGLHAGGSAGFASFGRNRIPNYCDLPTGWMGKWNVKGVAEGIQEGVEGKSYALPTVTGKIEPLSVEVILEKIQTLYAYARHHPDLELLIAYRDDGVPLINRYSIQEMADMFSSFHIPENIVFEDNFSKLLR